MKIGHYYERYWSTDGFCPHGKIWAELQHLYERWIPVGAKVLDVGCGDGQTSGAWLCANGRLYHGVDISANAVQEACRLGLQATEIEDASTLPFEPNSFDAVTCIEVLEHLFDPESTVAEIARILKPGGVLVATVPNIVFWRNRLDFFILGRWNPLGDTLSVKQPWRDPHIRFFTMASMRRFVRESGLSLIHIGGQSGGFLKVLPFLRGFSRSRASSLYRLLERAFPALFGYRIEIVLRK